MFRRVSPDGAVVSFDVAGLWGSGNTVGVRDGDGTVYSMWDGHALFGPGRPGAIERYPLLISVLGASDFLDRHGGLGDRCAMWAGEEVLGVGCDVACLHAVEACGQRPPDECITPCAGVPRAVVECLGDVEPGECDWERVCDLQRWAPETTP